MPHEIIRATGSDGSKLDGWPVVVLDADIRGDDPAHRDAAREAWRELVGDRKPTVKTGGGGAHLYPRCPPDNLPSEQSIVLRQSPDKVDDKPAWTIELLAGGHAVTLPPSIHPSGQPYEWVNGGLAHVEAMPEALLHAVLAIRQCGPGTGNRWRYGAKSDDYRTLDVRRWAREGVLRPGYWGGRATVKPWHQSRCGPSKTA
jgi:hypothetical protein